MRIVAPQRRLWSGRDGIALIIVMIVILTLGILAGGFAYSMKVETRLARNTSYEADLEWLGRSGVELGRYVLVQSLRVPSEPWDSLNQRWAGGPMGTNEALEAVSLIDNRLGRGSFSIEIIDLERKFNINIAGPQVLQRALEMTGADPGEIPGIVDSYLDWLDPDDHPHLQGTETEGYLALPNPGYPPYVAKNGPIDHVSELLLLRGMYPELYSTAPFEQPLSIDGGNSLGPPMDTGGISELFTALSAGPVNINTASIEVLQLVPGIDSGLAQGIVATRAGPDGFDGNEDDTPFRSPGELINVPGMSPAMVGQFQRLFTTRSATFEIRVDARMGAYRREYVAVARRDNQRDARILYFFWR